MKDFNKKIKMQMITDVISLICLILCIMSVGISFLLLISKLYSYMLICLLALLVFGGTIYYFRRKYNSGIENRYEFVLDKDLSYEDMKSQLENLTDASYSNNENNSSVYLLKEKKQEYRILLYSTDIFNNKKYYSSRKSANKGFNKKYSIDTAGSISDISKRNCINIAFVNENTDALEKMLNIPADDNINRASSLLSVAIVGNKLYIPYYVGYHFVASSGYNHLCNKVFELFGIKRK